MSYDTQMDTEVREALKQIMLEKEKLDTIMDFIIDQAKWAKTFPHQCLVRITETCEAIKSGDESIFTKIKNHG